MENIALTEAVYYFCGLWISLCTDTELCRILNGSVGEESASRPERCMSAELAVGKAVDQGASRRKGRQAQGVSDYGIRQGGCPQRDRATEGAFGKR